MDKLAAMTTLVTVVEAGSFTRAAEVLGLPKARISQRIADLERHLSVRLLNRTTRSLSLTADGQAYYAKCQLILQEIDELEGALTGATVQAKGRLRVEALVSVARWILGPRLHEFQALYPGIAIRLGGSDRISHLLEEGIDCAIRGGRLEDSTQIARHVCEVRLGLYAAPQYLARVSVPEHPAQLSEHQRLSWFPGPRNALAWTLYHTEAAQEVAGGEGLLFDDPDVAMASCMAGSGICPGAPFAVQQWVRSGQLVPVLPQWSFAARSIHLLYPSNKHLSARVRCFVDWALPLLQQHPALGLTPWQLAQSLGE
jgi:LysR family transcriptional regulator for bpeEF and oprC